MLEELQVGQSVREGRGEARTWPGRGQDMASEAGPVWRQQSLRNEERSRFKVRQEPGRRARARKVEQGQFMEHPGRGTPRVVQKPWSPDCYPGTKPGKQGQVRTFWQSVQIKLSLSSFC